AASGISYVSFQRLGIEPETCHEPGDVRHDSPFDFAELPGSAPSPVVSVSTSAAASRRRDRGRPPAVPERPSPWLRRRIQSSTVSSTRSRDAIDLSARSICEVTCCISSFIASTLEARSWRTAWVWLNMLVYHALMAYAVA